MSEKLKVATNSASLESELKKNKWVYTLLYSLAVAIIAAMLVFSYVSVFTSNFYPKSASGYYMVGVNNASNYYGADNGDLLYIESYLSSSQISTTDIIFFSAPEKEGTAKVETVSISGGYVGVINADGQSENISLSYIIGKLAKKSAGWGYVVWFFQSYTGVICLNILLILLVLARIILGYFIEPSPKGRRLLSALNKDKKERRRQSKIGKIFNRRQLPGGLDLVLDGNFIGNKNRIVYFAQNNDPASAYKYILGLIHKKYVVAPRLKVSDRRVVTNCIELMCMAKNLDANDEYKLSDLILHAPLKDFDSHNFCLSCQEYIENCNSYQGLLTLEYLIYLLIKHNRDACGKSFIKVIDSLKAKFEQNFSSPQQNNAAILASAIKNYYKF